MGIKTFDKIKILLKEASPSEDFSIRFLNNETWKVNPTSDDSFRQISEKLKDKNIQWYSHSNKNTRNIKVLCKGLPPSIPEEEIIEDLQSKNFKIKAAVCLRKRVEKSKPKVKPSENINTEEKSDPSFSSKKEIKEYEMVKIPIHQLDFDHSESVENIFKIKAIAHTIVKIEQLKTDPAVVPQCKRCCGWSHIPLITVLIPLGASNAPENTYHLIAHFLVAFKIRNVSIVAPQVTPLVTGGVLLPRNSN